MIDFKEHYEIEEKLKPAKEAMMDKLMDYMRNELASTKGRTSIQGVAYDIARAFDLSSVGLTRKSLVQAYIDRFGKTENVNEEAPAMATPAVTGAGDDNSLHLKKARLFKNIYRRFNTKKEYTRLGVKEGTESDIYAVRTAGSKHYVIFGPYKSEKEAFSDAGPSLYDTPRGTELSRKIRQHLKTSYSVKITRDNYDRMTEETNIGPHDKTLYYMQPDGSWKKGGDGRSPGKTRVELKAMGKEGKIQEQDDKWKPKHKPRGFNRQDRKAMDKEQMRVRSHYDRYKKPKK